MKVWIDCDPGIDDLLALTYALKSDNIEVMGISVVSGNVDCSKGYDNVLKLFEFLNFDPTEIPICKGYTGNDYINAEDTHGTNGIGNYYMPLTDYKPSASWSNFSKVVCMYPNEITLVCLGPLTNVARMVDNDIMNNLQQVVIMGGAFKYPGNCSPVSEYNFWCDPVSAKQFFEHFENCNKVTVIPLDATHDFVFNENDLDAIQNNNKRMHEFVKGITQYYFDFHLNQEGFYGCVLNDVLVIGYLKGFSNHLYPYYVQIVEHVGDKMIRGQMVVDEKKIYHHLPNCNIVAFFDDYETIMRDFIETICK
jgi:purine nucleosidase